MQFLRGLLVLFALGLSLNAQTRKPGPSNTPPPGVIHAVIVQGNKAYSTGELIKLLDLKPGQPATPDAFRAAQKRLLDTDLFLNVEYEFRFTLSKPAQYDVTYKVSEFEQLYPLQFEGLGVPDDALRDYLKQNIPLYSDRIPPTDPVLRRYGQAAQSFVAGTKPGFKVKAVVSSDNSDHPAVVIGPDRPLPRVAEVRVSGNKNVETPVLQRAVNEAAIGERLSDALLKQVLDRTIRPLYAAKGYAAVSFPKISSEKSPDNEGFIVQIQIQEGPVYHFGNAAFRGGAFTADDIRSMMKFQKGATFDGSKAEQLRKDLVASLRHDGHLDAKVELSQQQDDKNLAINLAYGINPGPVYTFQTLELHGLDIESEPQIRKLWAPKRGKPFNPEYPDYFLQRVREMGLFDNLGSMRSSFDPNETDHTVTVKLFFGGAQGEAIKARERGEPPPENPQPH